MSWTTRLKLDDPGELIPPGGVRRAARLVLAVSGA
jgi:hypothetical protein